MAGPLAPRSSVRSRSKNAADRPTTGNLLAGKTERGLVRGGWTSRSLVRKDPGEPGGWLIARVLVNPVCQVRAHLSNSCWRCVPSLWAMDLRQLAALVAVAEHGTFSAAADALHTVQSNVSTHVARLERELGTTLVDRSAGRLTEEGELVVARARRIQAELDALATDVASLRHEVAGTTRG